MMFDEAENTPGTSDSHQCSPRPFCKRCSECDDEQILVSISPRILRPREDSNMVIINRNPFPVFFKASSSNASAYSPYPTTGCISPQGRINMTVASYSTVAPVRNHEELIVLTSPHPFMKLDFQACPFCYQIHFDQEPNHPEKTEGKYSMQTSKDNRKSDKCIHSEEKKVVICPTCKHCVPKTVIQREESHDVKKYPKRSAAETDHTCENFKYNYSIKETQTDEYPVVKEDRKYETEYDQKFENCGNCISRKDMEQDEYPAVKESHKYLRRADDQECNMCVHISEKDKEQYESHAINRCYMCLKSVVNQIYEKCKKYIPKQDMQQDKSVAVKKCYLCLRSAVDHKCEACRCHVPIEVMQQGKSLPSSKHHKCPGLEEYYRSDNYKHYFSAIDTQHAKSHVVKKYHKCPGTENDHRFGNYQRYVSTKDKRQSKSPAFKKYHKCPEPEVDHRYENYQRYFSTKDKRQSKSPVVKKYHKCPEPDDDHGFENYHRYFSMKNMQQSKSPKTFYKNPEPEDDQTFENYYQRYFSLKDKQQNKSPKKYYKCPEPEFDQRFEKNRHYFSIKDEQKDGYTPVKIHDKCLKRAKDYKYDYQDSTIDTNIKSTKSYSHKKVYHISKKRFLTDDDETLHKESFHNKKIKATHKSSPKDYPIPQKSHRAKTAKEVFHTHLTSDKTTKKDVDDKDVVSQVIKVRNRATEHATEKAQRDFKDYSHGTTHILARVLTVSDSSRTVDEASVSITSESSRIEIRNRIISKKGMKKDEYKSETQDKEFESCTGRNVIVERFTRRKDYKIMKGLDKKISRILVALKVTLCLMVIVCVMMLVAIYLHARKYYK